MYPGIMSHGQTSSMTFPHPASSSLDLTGLDCALEYHPVRLGESEAQQRKEIQW